MLHNAIVSIHNFAYMIIIYKVLYQLKCISIFNNYFFIERNVQYIGITI